MKICQRLVQVRLRGGFPGKQLLRALCVYPCELERSLRAGQIALGLSDRGLKKSRINLRHDLAGFHLRIKIREQLRDVPRDLAAYLHVDHGIECAGCGNRLRNWPARNRCSLIISSATVAALPHDKRDEQQPDNSDEPGDETFHLSSG